MAGSGSGPSRASNTPTGGGANLLSNPGFETQTVNNWSLSTQARPTTQQAHEGVSSILLGSGGTASQTISGANPGQSYVLNGYYYITTGSTTATVNFGGGSAPGTVTGTWQPFTVSGTANGGGSLILQLAASTNAGAAVYFDDLSLSAGNPANPALSWGQSFGYDGFGNLLAETVTAGSAPQLSINVDPSTNRVVATGVQYDSAGNMTNDGSQAYTYDEANRIKTVGSYLYSYSGLKNKRLIVYNYNNPSIPSATFNLYGPDGKRLGWYTFKGASGGWGTMTQQGYANYLYLGNKALSFAEDRIGSNGAYYPYGTPYTGTNPGFEGQAFGTYVQDSGSSLLYADQRFYNPGFGRFMTADRSNANVDSGNPVSFNRYAYTNGDPVNGMDPSGMEDEPDPNGDAFGSGGALLGDDSCPGFCGSDSGDTPDLLFTPDQNATDPNGSDPGNITPESIDPNVPDPDTPPIDLPPAEGPDGSDLQASAPPFPCVTPVGVGGCVAWDIGLIAVGIGTILHDIFDNIVSSRRLIRVRASCSVHRAGTPDHASAGTVSAVGVGTNFLSARANAYSNAQAQTNARFGIGFHAQHCGYTVLQN